MQNDSLRETIVNLTHENQLLKAASKRLSH
jgi:hypothetical protein